MADDRKFISRDGTAYDTYEQKYWADKVVDEREKQTKIQQTMAEMEAFKLEQAERKMEQEKEMELSRQRHELAMEQVKHEHEKEMQLLKILDDVSIPLDVYKKFEENLFNSGNINPANAQEYSELMKASTEMLNKKFEDGEKFKTLLQRNMNYPNNEVKYTDKYKKFEDFINDKFSKTMLDMEVKEFDIISNSKDFVEIFTREKKYARQANKIYSFIGPINVLMGIGELVFVFKDSSLMGILLPVGVIQLSLGLIATFKYKVPDSKVTTQLKQELNKVINTQMADEYNQSNVSEEEKDIQDQMKAIQTKIHENSKTIIDQRLQDLYNFRLVHYNLKMEKLFYDVGLVNKCMENNYKWLDIDKKNIKNEGTYEDYFHYFNTYNPDNERRA